MERRDFIKYSCYACMGIGGLISVASLLTGCAALPVHKIGTEANEIEVPKLKFAESNMVLVRPLWMDFDILLIKNNDTDYKALLMKCSHQDQPLTATKTGLMCSSHGSTFNLKGEVTKEPAVVNLQSYFTQINETNILIQINKKS